MTDVAATVLVREEVETSSNGRTAQNRLSMVVFSGDMDRVMAALIIATGAASAEAPG